MDAQSQKTSVLKDKIQINLIFSSLWKSKRKYIIPLAVTFVAACVIALSIPRFYKVQVMLAPEYGGTTTGTSGLKSITSMMGLGSSGSSVDAITPMFYPDLMKSTDFVVPLLSMQVSTADNGFKGTLLEYKTKHNKAPWWEMIKGKIIELFKKPGGGARKATEISPYRMTRDEADIVKGVSSDIGCVVDKKTDVITITTVAQDPLVAAQIADTVMAHLQTFITEYRTKKARIDLQHYTQLRDEARANYIKVQRQYASYVDTHFDASLQSYKSEEERLENEMQIAYNQYNSLSQQVQQAHNRVEERTPVFTVLQNASVPTRHEGPKRMMMVLTFLFLAFVGTSIWIVAKEKSLKF